MKPRLLALRSLFCLALLALPSLARAESDPPNPLRLMPAETDFIVEVRDPRQLIDALKTLDAVGGFLKLEVVQEYYDSTTAHRLLQLLAYVEKELGAKWPELLDQIGGGGAVLGVKIGPQPAPALLVVHGKDEAKVRKFAQLGLQVLEGEIARQESKDKLEKADYRDVETYRIGTQFHAAVVGSALLIANQEKALQGGIDLHLDGDKKSLVRSANVAGARKLLPSEPLAMAWLNLETVRKAPGAKDVFTLPRNDANLTIAFGQYLDLAGRSPYVCGGLCRKNKELLLTFRAPRGREGMTEELALHVAPEDQAQCLPLLEPKGVIYSASAYFDLGKFWEQREKLFNKDQVKTFEDFDKNSGRFLAGTPVSKLLTQAGPYQRFVVACQDKTGYRTASKLPLPAFAFVVDMRDAEALPKAMDTVLRAVALLAGSQAGLKLVEEKHGDHTLVGYRFPEGKPLKQDTNDLRFNFSPCFVAVGNQHLICSTLELGHELIDLLEKEAKDPPAKVRFSSMQRFYSAGGAEYMKGFEDFFLTQTILSQAATPASAKAQVQGFLQWVRGLGTADIEYVYGQKESRIDIRLAPPK
jgi:hypothetical protein